MDACLIQGLSGIPQWKFFELYRIASTMYNACSKLHSLDTINTQNGLHLFRDFPATVIKSGTYYNHEVVSDVNFFNGKVFIIKYVKTIINNCWSSRFLKPSKSTTQVRTYLVFSESVENIEKPLLSFSYICIQDNILCLCLSMEIDS